MKIITGINDSRKFRQPYTERNTAEWVPSGHVFFERLCELIDSARHELHIQTYIFDSDETGARIAEALIRAAQQNVRVFLFLDAYGSQNMSPLMIQSLKNAGIKFRKYGQLYSRGRFHIGRRMHHKICVADGYMSIVGGMNIADKYNDINGPPWLDFAVVMKGDISRSLQVVCRRRWRGVKFSTSQQNQPTQDIKYGNTPIRIRRNDFVRNRNDIAISYREALRHAEKSLLMVGGYFLPGGRTRRLMVKAIQRGVKIEVLVSEHSDVKILVNARRYLYAWLIRNGINVYEYKPSNVHGKVLIVDSKWTTLGSYDLNNLSTYSNIELNIDIKEDAFAKSLSDYIQKIIREDCTKITSENKYSKSGIIFKFSMWLAYRAVKTLFGLSVLLAGKKEKEF